MQHLVSKRAWLDVLPPKYLHDSYGVYHGQWMPDMDRCWESDDGFQVMSRMLATPWGKVEHVSIMRMSEANALSSGGERDIPWAVKQQIKNELFGEKRLAIEVYPKQRNLVDVMDVYHLWVFDKDFDLPFGIHPTRDPKCRVVNRGCPKDVSRLVENSKRLHGDGVD